MKRLIFTEEATRILNECVKAKAPLETGAFCLLGRGKGIRSTRYMVTKIINEPPNAWEAQRPDQLRPSGQWISAIISDALENKAGILFIHSHPDPAFPQKLSQADNIAFVNLAKTIAPMLEGPLAAAIIHPNGWHAVVWENGTLVQIDRIASVGRTFKLLSPLQEAQESLLDDRQKEALGTIHNILQSLSIAIVGCGGIGTPLAEQLIRAGCGELILIDKDRLDTASNVRRMFGTRVFDLNRTPPVSKVDLLEEHLSSLGFKIPIRSVSGDVRKEQVYRELLDADIVLSVTDTHGSRAVINSLPSSYFLPVIDAGVRVGLKGSSMVALLSEIRILTSSTPCLWCRHTIDGNTIRLENLPEDELIRQKKEGYVSQSFGDPAPVVVALTVLCSGLIGCALLTLLSEEGYVSPSGYWFDGFFGDSMTLDPKIPDATCSCQLNKGKGDLAPPHFTC